MLSIFEPSWRRRKDAAELRDLFRQYGEQTPQKLQLRANDPNLSSRDRRHWQRLARKARWNPDAYSDE